MSTNRRLFTVGFRAICLSSGQTLPTSLGGGGGGGGVVELSPLPPDTAGYGRFGRVAQGWPYVLSRTPWCIVICSVRNPGSVTSAYVLKFLLESKGLSYHCAPHQHANGIIISWRYCPVAVAAANKSHHAARSLFSIICRIRLCLVLDRNITERNEQKVEGDQANLPFLDITQGHCISEDVKTALEAKLAAALGDDSDRAGRANGADDREAMETEDDDPAAAGNSNGNGGMRNRPPAPTPGLKTSPKHGTPGVKRESGGMSVDGGGGGTRPRMKGVLAGVGARGVYKLWDFKDYHEMKEKVCVSLVCYVSETFRIIEGV